MGRGRAGATGSRPRGRRPQRSGLQLTQEDFDRIEELQAEMIANEDVS